MDRFHARVQYDASLIDVAELSDLLESSARIISLMEIKLISHSLCDTCSGLAQLP
jgi:hypothetical protein